MDFGFTNDEAMLIAANKFREDAIADGWSCKATYENHEPVESAAKLEKDGFVMMIISRTHSGRKWKYEAKVSIWGPDELAIIPPNNYDWGKIKSSTRTCNACERTDVDTQRVGFAGRCCEDCLSEQRKKHEYAGWTN